MYVMDLPSKKTKVLRCKLYIMFCYLRQVKWCMEQNLVIWILYGTVCVDCLLVQCSVACVVIYLQGAYVCLCIGIHIFVYLCNCVFVCVCICVMYGLLSQLWPRVTCLLCPGDLESWGLVPPTAKNTRQAGNYTHFRVAYFREGEGGRALLIGSYLLSAIWRF